jgi:hypothetical protein
MALLEPFAEIAGVGLRKPKVSIECEVAAGDCVPAASAAS